MRGIGATGAGLAAAMLMAAGGPAGAQAPAPPPGPKVLYMMEQLRTTSLPPAVLNEIGPLHTLSDIEAVLKAHRTPFAWVVSEVRSANLPPAMVAQMAKLPPGEPMVLPLGQVTVIAVVVGKRPDPGGPPPPTAHLPPVT